MSAQRAWIQVTLQRLLPECTNNRLVDLEINTALRPDEFDRLVQEASRVLTLPHSMPEGQEWTTQQLINYIDEQGTSA